MLITCPECHKENVSDSAFACPSCGYPISGIKMRRKDNENRNFRRLPSGFGTIKKLQGKRRNKFVAYPSVREFGYKDNGTPLNMPAIGYYETWQSAYDALIEYNKNPYDITNRDITFSQVHELFFDEKFNQSKKELSKQSRSSAMCGFNNLKPIHDVPLRKLKPNDIQKVIDDCDKKHATLELMVQCVKNVYKYAIKYDLVAKDIGQFVQINVSDDDENGVPFTQRELDILWDNKDDKAVRIALILIYTGFRISELKVTQIDLENRTMSYGMKTKAGKERVVPIHPLIYDYVKEFNQKTYVAYKYRNEMFTPTLERLGILMSVENTKHTPHDTRHTFSWLADKYKMDNISKHLIMGHSLGKDVEDKVYGHRNLQELKTEMEKIKYEREG